MKSLKTPLAFALAVLALSCCLSCASGPAKAERLAARVQIDADYQRRLDQWPVPFEVRYLRTRYGPTHAIVSGPEGAPLLVLLHAMGMNALSYAPNAAALSKEYRIAAIDTIGDQGLSIVRSAYPESGKEYSDWVADVVASLGAGKAGIVACSMGGWIAICTAAYHPETVDRLVLISPAAGIPAKTTWGPMISSIIFDSSEKNLRRFASVLFGAGAAARDWTDYFLVVGKQAESSRISAPADLPESDLRKIAAPVLLLVGDHDAVFENAAQLMENARLLIPRVETSLIPDAWHIGNYDNPEFVNDAILRFLAGVLSGG
jgi:pimeloyl-ACP methyl ester carboxylesterase